MKETAITAHVGIGPRDDGEGFGIQVQLNVHMPETDEKTVRELIEKAHVIYPCSHAIRNNVEVTTTIV